MRYFLFFLFCAFFLTNANAQTTVVEPNDFTEISAPDSSNFEFYTRKQRVNRKASWTNVKKAMMPKVRLSNVTSDPTATGNTNYRGEVVRNASGAIWLVDGYGNGRQLNASMPNSLIQYASDALAASGCVCLGCSYYLSASNTYGYAAGTVRVNLVAPSGVCN